MLYRDIQRENVKSQSFRISEISGEIDKYKTMIHIKTPKLDLEREREQESKCVCICVNGCRW